MYDGHVKRILRRKFKDMSAQKREDLTYTTINKDKQARYLKKIRTPSAHWRETG
jgi:hypothetical protein